MEYSDTINTVTFEKAVSLARQLQSERHEPVAKSAEEAVWKSFCVCVTDGEDAAEHRFSAIHRELIVEVIARVRVADSASEGSIDV